MPSSPRAPARASVRPEDAARFARASRLRSARRGGVGQPRRSDLGQISRSSPGGESGSGPSLGQERGPFAMASRPRSSGVHSRLMLGAFASPSAQAAEATRSSASAARIEQPRERFIGTSHLPAALALRRRSTKAVRVSRFPSPNRFHAPCQVEVAGPIRMPGPPAAAASGRARSGRAERANGDHKFRRRRAHGLRPHAKCPGGGRGGPAEHDPRRSVHHGERRHRGVQRPHPARSRRDRRL